MESVAPPLECIFQVQMDLKSGRSLQSSLSFYAQEHQDEFTIVLSDFLIHYHQGLDLKNVINSLKSPYRKALLQIFLLGLKGAPIFDHLESLEKEVLWACEQELDGFFKTLSFTCLIPILFLQFPAFLLLVFGPLLKVLMEKF